jgi:hypothetical protein
VPQRRDLRRPGARLRDAYYERHKKAIAAGVGELLVVLSGNEGQLAADARERATRAELTLRERFGYSRESARDLVGALVSARYR